MKAEAMFVKLTLAMALVSVFSVLPAPAQNTPNTPGTTQNKGGPPTDRPPVSKITHHGKSKPVKPDKFLDYTEKPPEMPGITFPNGKYIYGFDNDNRNGGRNKGANFSVQDNPESVISFYRGALCSGGWELCKPACTNNKVVANNKQLHCAVTVTADRAHPGSKVGFAYAIHH